MSSSWTTDGNQTASLVAGASAARASLVKKEGRWDGQSRVGDGMVRDYKGGISVETIETLSCGKVFRSWTKPFDDSNLSDSLKQEASVRMF